MPDAEITYQCRAGPKPALNPLSSARWTEFVAEIRLILDLVAVRLDLELQ